MNLYIPVNITYETVIQFSRQLKNINLNEYNGNEIILNIRNMMKVNGRIEPFAALLLRNSLFTFKKLANQNGITINIAYLSENRIKNNYAKNLRFYSSLGLPFGERPTEDYNGSAQSTFIPIIKLDASEVFKSTDEYNEIKGIAKKIATVASRGNEELFNCIAFCVTEIIRNVLEHSNSSFLWYSAQCWSSSYGGELVEIAIMDEGIGIQNSLQKELGDEEDILKFSLIPGCSSKPTTHYIGDNADNSGVGLFMISEIGKKNGDFIINSNNESFLLADDYEEYKQCLTAGTMLRLRLRIDSIDSFETQKEELIQAGEELTKKYLNYSQSKKFAPGLPVSRLF